MFTFNRKLDRLSVFKKALILIFGIGVVIVVFNACVGNQSESKEGLYLNHNDTVKYVGLSTCAACHSDKAETFLHTGMGSSFGIAGRSKSSAEFGKNHIVYDTFSNFYYKPFWKNNELYVLEYRLQNKDTIHRREEKIDYIIGSGQHTNSHLIFRNGYVYQAPLTWYSQEHRWGMPPGFESGRNSRFRRLVNVECMSCHNSMPVMQEGSEMRFESIGMGIDCERCHGPGELHVKMRSKGQTNYVQNGIDRTIVNPAKLDWNLQVDLCQRCHLQGNAVLKKNRYFTDFKPGMELKEYFDVFMPDYENNRNGMIMASHAQRLQLSNCFIRSNNSNASGYLKLTCITCHDPHVSVKVTGKEKYNKACNSCHKGEDECGESKSKRMEKGNDCVSCHMPSSGTIDIPHVTVHDHYIRKPEGNKVQLKKGLLKGLYCINNDKPDKETMIRAYLSYYEKFDPKKLYLQMAEELLKPSDHKELWIHLYYLKGAYRKLIKIADKVDPESTDAWTSYRIGQAYINLELYSKAEAFLLRANKLSKDNFDFLYKQSVVSHQLGKTFEEEVLLKKVLALNPDHRDALNSAGLLYFKNGQYSKAKYYYSKGLIIDPDFLPLLKNLFDYYNIMGNQKNAVDLARRILAIEPQNAILKNYLKNNP
ncbi:MAG: tetratricopeptide repeat protein [Flavobacteriales bacterium]|nr:tetratricopeptide repeat protein [Flavobacteriales bacterium]